MESPTVSMIGEGPGYWQRRVAAMEQGSIAGSRVRDARIAAICANSGVSELWTADRDFGRFSIRVRNPLVG